MQEKKAIKPFPIQLPNPAFYRRESPRNMGDDGGTEPPPPPASSPSGKVEWTQTTTLGRQFLRLPNPENPTPEMYAARDGSASSINGDQTGMRIVGFCLWVRLRSNPGPNGPKVNSRSASRRCPAYASMCSSVALHRSQGYAKSGVSLHALQQHTAISLRTMVYAVMPEPGTMTGARGPWCARGRR